MLHKCFFAMLTLIGSVSLIDTWLIVRFEDVLRYTEENPMGRWLIEASHGDVSLFVLTKLIGTILVLSILWGMERYRYRRTMSVTTSITVFQLSLLSYLTLA